MKVKVADIVIMSNVRSQMDKSGLKELAQSIQEVGLINPITIAKSSKNGKYTLVAGERRLRAVKEVLEAETIEATIVKGDEQELLEIQIVENLQREDVHPLDEALGFELLANNKSRALTVTEIAERVGKSVQYVAKRKQISNLLPTIQKAVRKGEFEFERALELAAIDQKHQKVYYRTRSSWNDTAADVKRWINEYVHANLKSAPFKLDREFPVSGACTVCPKRSSQNVLFSDDKTDRCLDPECYSKKVQVTLKERVKSLESEHGEVAIVSESYSLRGEKTPYGVVTDKEFYEVPKDAEGAIPAVAIDGRSTGKVAFIKFGKKREAGAIAKVDPKVAYEKRMNNLGGAIRRDIIRTAIKSAADGGLKIKATQSDLNYLLMLRAFDLMGGQCSQLIAKSLDLPVKDGAPVSGLDEITKRFQSDKSNQNHRNSLASLILLVRSSYDGIPAEASLKNFKEDFLSIFDKADWDSIEKSVKESYKEKLDKAKSILKPKAKGKKK